MNPFLQLQQNASDLITAHPYFAGATVLTEKLADLEAQIESKLINAFGFGVVITTARGDRLGDPNRNEEVPLVLREELTVSIISVPALDAKHNALDGLHAAIEALSGQPSDAGANFVWRVLGHEYQDNAREGSVIHHLRINTHLPI